MLVNVKGPYNYKSHLIHARIGSYIRTNTVLGTGEAKAEYVRAKARDYFDLIENKQKSPIHL
jgi:hypothetical protein